MAAKRDSDIVQEAIAALRPVSFTKRSVILLDGLEGLRDKLREREALVCGNTGCPAWLERYVGNCKIGLACIDFEEEGN